MNKRVFQSVLAVLLVCVVSYFASSRRPLSGSERFRAEAKRQLGLTEIWLKQPGNNIYRGRGIDAKGGDFDLLFERRGTNVWTYTATDRQTRQERHGELRW